MPHADRRTDVSPGQAAVRQAGLATPAGNRSRHWVTGADAGAVDDRQLRGWLAVVAGNSRTPSSPPMASSTAAACRGCPDGARHGEPPAGTVVSSTALRAAGQLNFVCGRCWRAPSR